MRSKRYHTNTFFEYSTGLNTTRKRSSSVDFGRDKDFNVRAVRNEVDVRDKHGQWTGVTNTYAHTRVNGLCPLILILISRNFTHHHLRSSSLHVLRPSIVRYDFPLFSSRLKYFISSDFSGCHCAHTIDTSSTNTVSNLTV